MAVAILVTFGASQAFAQFRIMHNYGLERGDYKDFALSRAAWEDCRDACAAETACLSFTYTIPIPGPNGRPAHCWLKNVVPRGEGRDWCISGIKETPNACGGGTGYSLRAPGTAQAGVRIAFSFSTLGPKPTSTGQWIGLMKDGTNDYVDWLWVKDASGCEASVRGQAPGKYEFRYFLDGGYDKVAARSSITIN